MTTNLRRASGATWQSSYGYPVRQLSRSFQEVFYAKEDLPRNATWPSLLSHSSFGFAKETEITTKEILEVPSIIFPTYLPLFSYTVIPSIKKHWCFYLFIKSHQFFFFTQGRNSRNHSSSPCYILFPLLTAHFILFFCMKNTHFYTITMPPCCITLQQNRALFPCLLLSVFLEFTNFHSYHPTKYLRLYPVH